jgi:putative endonuclease
MRILKAGRKRIMTTTRRTRRSGKVGKLTSGWCVYILMCAGVKNSLVSYYIGATNDWDNRWRAHVSGRGAKYTRSHPPVAGIVVVFAENRSEAQRVESRLKLMTSREKQELMSLTMDFDPDVDEPWNGPSYFRSTKKT